MKERSHKKGEVYQQDAKHWLLRSGFLGFETKPFGDTYDFTKKACTIGGVGFDFSLKLCRDDQTQHISYVECKCRNERRGDVSADFKEFLKRVSRALAEEPDRDDTDNAYFVFLSTVPPDGWREYLKGRHQFCDKRVDWEQNPPAKQVLDELVQRVHVLVVSEKIIARVI